MHEYASHTKNLALLSLHENVNVFYAIGKVKKKKKDDNHFEIIIKYILNQLDISNNYSFERSFPK